MRAAPASILATGPSDAPALAAIHAEAFETPWDTTAFASLLVQPGVFAIREADGLILCRVILDEAEVLTLAVRPPARRRGLGARLTRSAAVLAALAGADRLFLEVAEDNAAARALYTRLDFVQTGRRRDYYARENGAPVDALLFVLNLPGRLPMA